MRCQGAKNKIRRAAATANPYTISAAAPPLKKRKKVLQPGGFSHTKGGERMESLNTGPADYSGLSWEQPPEPHRYANVVVVGKSVVLVRHSFADTGDVEKIYNEFIDEKVAENGSK